MRCRNALCDLYSKLFVEVRFRAKRSGADALSFKARMAPCKLITCAQSSHSITFPAPAREIGKTRAASVQCCTGSTTGRETPPVRPNCQAPSICCVSGKRRANRWSVRQLVLNTYTRRTIVFRVVEVEQQELLQDEPVRHPCRLPLSACSIAT